MTTARSGVAWLVALQSLLGTSREQPVLTPGSTLTPLCGAGPVARAPDQHGMLVLPTVHGALTADKPTFPAQVWRSLG